MSSLPQRFDVGRGYVCLGRLELFWLGLPLRLGHMPPLVAGVPSAYRWMFDVGPIRVNWMNRV